MKALLLIAFLAATFMSCKKESEKCYHCTFGMSSGVQPPPQDYCGDDGGTRKFYAPNGDELQSYCTEK